MLKRSIENIKGDIIMKIKNYLICLILISPTIKAYHLESQEIFSLKTKGETQNRSDVIDFFHPCKISLNNQSVITDPAVLLDAAKSAFRYFKSQNKINKKIINPRLFSQKIMSPYQVKNTLEFIISSIEQDIKKKTSPRILNSTFLEKNFKFIKWSGDYKSAQKNNVKIPENVDNGKIPKGKIRLTNYAAFVLNGNNNKTNKFPCALYSIKSKDFESKGRFRYTKQDVFDGALHNKKNKNQVTPLVWLNKNDLETAIMQGTTYVKMPNGKKRLFVVDKNNGFSYDKKIKNSIEQKRYWYFKEINNPNYYKKKGVHINHGGVVFAGDIYNVGLGKIIAIKYQNPISKKDEIRLGILADSGSALTNNLYQLDLFAGIFDTQNEFKKWLKQIPNTVEAYILVKK